jgi:2-iminobutanoate/2-iminopropanoate deaminase
MTKFIAAAILISLTVTIQAKGNFMSKKVVLTKDAPAPIGPYSQAMQMGDFLYCSGQIPLDPASGTIVGIDAAAQTKQVMKNIGAVLSAAGLSYKNIFKTTIFIKNMNDFAAVNTVYGEFLSEPFPARSTVEVARLPKDVLVEIEVIAHK